MTWLTSSGGRRRAGLEALPCFSLMDSDVSMHTFFHSLVLLAVVIALITWWDRRASRRS